MKTFAIPTVCSAIVALLSLIFYAAFSHYYGDALLGWIIILSASMSIVQLGLVPQAWLYVMSGSGDSEIERRFSIGVLVEAGGGLLGIFVLAALYSLPIQLVRDYPWESLLVFAGLWIAGSTAVQGMLRAQGKWRSYAGWIVTPSILRVILILLVPPAASAGKGADLGDHSVALVAIYFFLPDLIRYLLVNLVFLVRSFRLPSMRDFSHGLRNIWHNWYFDFGSAIMDSGDKIVVGALVGPHLLTAYFFARKIGAAATILIEPYYAEHYRRIILGSPEQRRSRQIATYLRASLLCAGASIAGASAVYAISEMPHMSHYVPNAVYTHLLLFCAVLLIDSGIAANRWSRYLSQSGSRSLILLICRGASFIVFGLSLFLLKDLSGELALLVSYVLLWLLDSIFVVVALNLSVSRANALPAVTVGLHTSQERQAGSG